MSKKVLLAVVILLTGSLFITQPLFAAWTQAKGHSYNQLTYSHYVTDHKMSTVTKESTVERNTKYQASKFRSQAITYYGEYGITDKLTVFTAIPYKWTKSDDVQRYANRNDSPHGIGDIDVGLRYNLFPSLAGFVVSVQGAVKIPKAYKFGDPMNYLSLGDGQYDYSGILMLGKGLGKGYATLAIAYKYRDENKEFAPAVYKPSDQVKVTFGGGYSITSWLGLRALVDYTHSVGNAEVSQAMIRHAWDSGSATAIRRGPDDYEHAEDILIKDSLVLEPQTLNVSGSIVFSHKKMQFVLSYGADIPGIEDWGIYSKNSGLGEAYSVALVYMY
ncbi:MAG TPA: hypothetical protein ENH31_03085 [Nitrospirae bacterium]|nr:hypothetical protein BMS3Abin10_02067 [bacterium BMS3Abin10]GBE37999.1 hypothetical protein BMS3Bbin08_00598 [bacterium BMS3Bbin08]HDH51105.1 hypothetical protein [Nitrospirota bacterium]HDK16904.1 hypothetical protein [Nitrospirota bacterium]HDK81538.1 hypothetical protein [Nitrospirota bacterium]